MSAAPAFLSVSRPPTPLHQIPGLWRGHDLAASPHAVVRSGWDELDAQLPMGGWPCGELIELMGTPPGVWEFRLLGQALVQQCQTQALVLLSPPNEPHLPGLAQLGINPSCITWIDAQTPTERLWVTEQLLKANAAGAVLAWLPQARTDQLRRLQVAAQHAQGLLFVVRDESALRESSPAPLRINVRAVDWTLQVHLCKRRGPPLDAPLQLASVPGWLGSVLTARSRQPARLRTPSPSVGVPLPTSASHPVFTPDRHVVGRASVAA